MFMKISYLAHTGRDAGVIINLWQTYPAYVCQDPCKPSQLGQYVLNSLFLRQNACECTLERIGASVAQFLDYPLSCPMNL